MTQEAIAVSTTPPLPGLQMVQQVNAALQTIATDFAGPDDPAALSGPFMVWADTANMLIKRRNAAGTAWVVEGSLSKESLNKQDNLAGLTNLATARTNLGLGTAATASATSFGPMIRGFNSIGSTSLLKWGAATAAVASGEDVSGANLFLARADGTSNATPIGGTWRNMGATITPPASDAQRTTSFEKVA